MTRLFFDSLTICILFFSLWPGHVDLHGVGDRDARDHGDQVRRRHLDRASHLAGLVHVLADALSFRQLTGMTIIIFSDAKSCELFSLSLTRSSLNVLDFLRDLDSCIWSRQISLSGFER